MAVSIFLFGYDSASAITAHEPRPMLSPSAPAGIAGGVVTQATFQQAFGVTKAELTTVSSNIVSVLQAGAFFGALSSAPISGPCTSLSKPCVLTTTLAWLGRRYCNILFSVIFTIGAVSPLVSRRTLF